MGKRKTPVITLSGRAMATLFEIKLWGGDELFLRTVAEEAMSEIRRLEQQLSLYREDSEIYELNYRAWKRPIPVDPRLVQLLARARELSALTGGAFDITVAPLVRAWGFMGASGAPPNADDVSAAREVVGMGLIELDEDNHTVRFLREGVMIDLGAIGKGYAVEQVAGMLRDYEVGGALIHGGTSTVQAVGPQPDGSGWPIAIQDPTDSQKFLTVVYLRDSALSVSAVHGKYFQEGDERYGHVIDPRAGAPVQGALLSAVVSPSATETDALSTGLLVSGESLMGALCDRPGTGALVVLKEEDGEPTMVTCNLPEERPETAMKGRT
jgi:FAD:protein FMN transferase